MGWTREEWAGEALRRRVERLRGATEGERHDECFRAGAALGAYVACGALPEARAVAALADAAQAAGKRRGEAERTIRDGLAKGSTDEPWWPATSSAGRIEVVRWGNKVIRLPSSDAQAAREGGPVEPPPLRQVDLSGIVLPTVQREPGTVEITRFGGPRQVQGGRHLLSWPALVEEMRNPVPWPGAKDGLPLWCPTLLEGDTRAKGTPAECVTLLVLDYDDDDDWSVERVRRDWWPEVRHVAHTSASHQVEKTTSGGKVHPARPRGRVVVDLSRPVSLDEHAQIAEWVLQSGRGTPGAAELRSRARAYYAPTEAPGGYESGAHDPGAVVDVDALLDAIRRAVEGEGEEKERAAQEGQPLIVKVQGGASGWFVQRDHGYVAVDGPLLRVELERAHDVTTRMPSEDGPGRPMRPDELYATYGARADRLVYSMVGGSAGYQANPHTGGGTLTLQVCREDPRLQPRYDAEVDEWLDRLVGAQSDRLRDWLACCMDLSRPIAALYLQGSDSVGKGMLAAALGRLYGRSTVAYADVLGGFNSALKTSPIVYLDERAPRMANGSAGFRTLVGDSSRQLTEKYQPTATLLGCPRLVVAANNSDALRLSEEDLERADEEAIALRILHLMVEPGCKAWLQSLGGRAHTDDWVEMPDGSPGRLCGHVAWLREHWQVTRPGRRLLVEGDSERWLRRTGMREGLPRRILGAIAAAAEAHQLTRLDEGERPVLWGDGVAMVQCSRLGAHWSDLTGEGRAPSVSAVGKALTRLGAPNKRAPRTVAASRPRVREVPAAMVVEAAIDMGIGDEDAIARKMGTTVAALGIEATQ